MSVNSIDELHNELDFSQDKLFELEQRVDNIERYVKALLLLRLCDGGFGIASELSPVLKELNQEASRKQLTVQEVG